MGNTPSRSDAARSGRINDGDRSGSGNVSGLVFRRPRRDAFLPMDHCANDDNVAGDDGGRGPLPPPRPPPPGEISPTTNCRSPPSVTSTSCDSSYATQVSPMSGGNVEIDHEEYYGNKSPSGQAGEVYSTHQSYIAGLYQHFENPCSSPAVNILPGHHLSNMPKQRPLPSNDDGGIFDCVKPHNLMTILTVAHPSNSPSSISSSPTQLFSPRLDNNESSFQPRSPSLTLFGACIRSSDDADDENEYTNEDLISCSDHSSHQGKTTNYSRSCSVGSASSQVSQRSRNSHNSYKSNCDHSNNNYDSKASLLSAFSSFSNASSQQRQSHASLFLFTEEEMNMPDGDEPTHESDLGRVRTYHVVTTAALPWMTGTAVNPLLRAAHLLRRNRELLQRQGEWERQGGGEVKGQGDGSGDDGDDNESPIEIKIASPTEVISVTPGSVGAMKAPNLKKLNGKRQQQRRHVGRDGSTAKSSPMMDNLDQPSQSPSSPCSLDYSRFSLSEIGATPNNHPTTAASVIEDNSRVDDISPLGTDVEMGKEDSFYSCFSDAISPMGDSLLLSPFTTAEVSSTCETMTVQSQNNDDETNEKMGLVTLVIPWLTDARDRIKLYGPAVIRDPNDESALSSEEEEEKKKNEVTRPMFASQVEQEEYIRSWLADDAGMPEEANELNILFYPARFHKFYNSIFALGDICDLIPDESADVCILEEPEHLNWYRAPGCSTWSSKFAHCVGVIHTNYKAYAREHAPAGFLAAPLLAGVNSMVVQANCHRVVKLSAVLQEFVPMGECIENVHGIRETYLKEGERRRKMSTLPTTSVRSARRTYFIGKLLWAKGFDKLLELETSYRERSGDFFEIDIFGSGPDELEIKRAFSGGGADDDGSGILHSLNKKWSCSDLNKKWSSSDLHRKLSSTDLHRKWSGRRQHLPANFKGKVDHSALAGDEYSIFVNPSLTEVLCTTTAEAIAMGKWVIVPSHPSNAFFVQFPNCLPYRNRREFVSTLRYALNNDPPHLSDELSSLLSWEAATARCVSAATISKREASRNDRLLRAKEEKTLKSTLSGLWSGSKGDLNEGH